jgi:hypothetical protein
MKETPSFQADQLTSTFIESSVVVLGVTCDVYVHPETDQRDLGIITIDSGAKTPLQKVLNGDLTIEGYLEGEGRLIITHIDGSQSVFEVDASAGGFCFSVEVGEYMQWQAALDQKLVVFEVCFPPYQDGRFENISE